MLARVLAIVVAATCVSSVASAGVITANDPVFGAGALTRDTGQGLDFLDLTLSTDRTFIDVSGQFGAGGDFTGFRYATEAEVIALINNWGFVPGAVAGLDVFGPNGLDQLSGLVDLLGVTQTISSIRRSLGITGTFLGAPNASPTRGIDIQDRELPQVFFGDRVIANFPIDGLFKAPSFGSFLVRNSPPGFFNGDFQQQLDGWTATGPGTAAAVEFPTSSGNLVAQLTSGSPVILSQNLDTPSSPFLLNYDFRFLSTNGVLDVLLDGMTVDTLTAASFGPMTSFDSRSLFINNPAKLGLTDVPLEFRWDGPTGAVVQLDNVSISSPVPEPTSLVLLATGALGLIGYDWRRKRKGERKAGHA